MAILNEPTKPTGRIPARRRFPAWLRLAGVFGLIAAGRLWAGAGELQPSEYQIKAAFLVNFPRYVDWPSSAFADSNSPVVIAVLGDNKFGGDLDKMVSGKTVNQRSLAVRYVTRVEDVKEPCHILFVPASEENRLSAILEKFKGLSVLTVGESDGFLDNGGMINLARQDKKVRLEVNLAPTRNAGLRISSRLLTVAAVVKGREN